MLVVRLQYLVAREGGWGAQAEWGETLSLGGLPPLLTQDSGLRSRGRRTSQVIPLATPVFDHGAVIWLMP